MKDLALIGKKIGMTREFLNSGQSVPVTVVQMEKGRIINIIQKENRGYSAIQVGFGSIKNSKIRKSKKGYFAKKNTEPKKTLKEFRTNNLENFKEGNELGLERATHGVSISHRSHGSTGQRQDPGKVFKGKKMAGHMGDKVRTIQNLEIIKSDLENNLLYLKGSIPGSKNTQVLVKKSIKNVRRLSTIEKIEKNKKTNEIKKKTK